MAKEHHPERERRVYGRRIGRPLNKGSQRVLEETLPRIQIKRASFETENMLDEAALFGAPSQELYLEIGFGNGEHLAALMQEFPQAAFIGAEPYMNGVASFLKKIKDTDKSNIRIFSDDAMLLVRALNDSSLDKIYVLNPDPWPKKRHHKRRIINKENLDQFARVLKPGGQLITATDVDGLAGWIVTKASHHPAFEWLANSKKDWNTPPPEWIKTRYAEKGEEKGHTQYFLLFTRTHPLPAL